jgi:hypothetical protein
MYLPLAGHFEKEKTGEEMSINSIGPGVSVYTIRPAEKKVDVHQENQKFGPPEIQKNSQPAGESGPDATEQAVPTNGCMSKISTEGFLILKAQTKDEPYAVLDKVIATMKQNMEELGEAIETMKELAEKTSKERIGLQLLEKTLEAIEEIRGDG